MKDPISKKGRALMGASLVQQAKNFKFDPEGNWELRGWGVRRRGNHKKDQQQKNDIRHGSHTEIGRYFISSF